MTQQTIILAAGGTGGHIFPAKALGEELIKQGHDVHLLTDERHDQYQQFADGIAVHRVSSSRLSGGLKAKFSALIQISLGVIQAVKIISTLKAKTVVGFGGYPSLPTVVAARLLGCRIILHEQNAVLGRVNRLLASCADVIATSFDQVSHIKPKYQHKIQLVGNPVRPDIEALREISYPELKEKEHLHILVIGGSQGANFFSHLMVETMKQLPANLRKRIRLDQQCRKEDLEYVQKAYAKLKIDADLATFFSDVPARLAAAHLVVSRAGASTIAEITNSGRASILVPYMHAMDDHQTANAQSLALSDAAIYVPEPECSAEILSNKIKEIFKKPELLSNLAINAFDQGRVKAAKRLAKLVLVER